MRAAVDTRSRAAALIPAEVLLVAVTVVAVTGFVRLFSDRGAVLPLLVLALSAHAVAIATRRLGLGVAATSAIGLGGLALVSSVVLYPHVSVAGLPGGATLDAVGDDLRSAWELFGDVVAPAPSSRGFLLAAGVAIWLAAGLSDWAAFRLRATAEAVLPAGALFVFTAILGRGTGGVVLATALAAAVLAFALAQRTVRSAADDSWIAGRATSGAAALARSGGLIVLAAALVAGAITPEVPGAEDEALVDWRGGDGSDPRLTISPLVDIRTRLVQQSDTTVFTVEAPRSAYWRLTSLDRFDGELWSSSESFSEADGSLPSEPPDAATSELVQTFTIGQLGTIWAPAALTPITLEDATTELRWNGELATLIVPGSQLDIDLESYRVVSRVPQFVPEDLGASLPSPLPDELAEAVELPDDLPSVVAELALEATEGAGPTPYARALALQDWFRQGFTYDLEGVGPGHGDSAIEAFLEAKRGYCEQFAGTYAAMARTLGIPARVAVGFTPGEVDAAGTTYTVRGRNAHAWPEVHIPGAGWVPFEPTPGRGQPGAEAYTGVEPAQDVLDEPAPGQTTTTTTTEPSGPSATTTPRSGTPTTPPAADRAAPGPLAPRSTDGGGGVPGPVRAAAIVVGVLLAALALDVAALAVLRARRRRRRRHATTVPARVRGAWSEAVEALGRAGPVPAPSETDAEFAARAAAGAGPASGALARLAGLVTRTTWSPAAATADAALADEADGLAQQVRAATTARLTRAQRLRTLVDPRSELHLR